MSPRLSTPGVYRQERFTRSPEALPTGVPGFVGLGFALDEQGQVTSKPVPQELLHADQLAARWVPRENGRTFLAEAVAGFFANGGTRCYLVGAGDPEQASPPETDGGKARLLSALSSVVLPDDVDLLAVPDAMVLPAADAQLVQRELLRQCTLQRNRFALLDGPRVGSDATNVAPTLSAWRDQVVAGGNEAANGALYFPWISTADSADSLPPCGHVAGIISRTDAEQGVFKAPANVETAGAVSLDYLLDQQTHGELNLAGINCLRSLPGRGLRVLGARTLSADPSWRAVNVRRTALTLARWIERNMTWATYEPNAAFLWNRIQRELGAYLDGLWRDGGLQGATPSEAYRVKCDAETNPQEVRELGQVVTEVALAPTSPAEFIVVHITQRAGSTQLS